MADPLSQALTHRAEALAMATDSPLLRLPLEIRLEIYRHVIPSLITVNPCQPRLQTPSLRLSDVKVPIPPWFEHAALPLPCMAAVSTSRAPVITTDPCLALRSTCRPIHNELSQYYHCSSSAHGLKMGFCSATCMLAYAVAAPACVLRRVRQVDVKMYGAGGTLKEDHDALSAVQVHIDRFQKRLQEAMEAERVVAEDKVGNKGQTDDALTLRDTSDRVACSVALRGRGGHGKTRVGCGTERGALVIISVVLAAAK